MFTGIIEATATVKRVERQSGRKPVRLLLDARRLAALWRLKPGASVAVNGTCLTLVRCQAGRLCFDVIAETLRRTTLGGLAAGDRVNLERAMRARDRFEGHFVLGHVDGTGRILKILKRAKETAMCLEAPPRVAPYLFEKGSVAVDGVSLTIGKVRGRRFWIHLIPHTLGRTRLGRNREGDRVNLEADLLVKLALRMGYRKTLGVRRSSIGRAIRRLERQAAVATR